MGGRALFSMTAKTIFLYIINNTIQSDLKEILQQQKLMLKQIAYMFYMYAQFKLMLKNITGHWQLSSFTGEWRPWVPLRAEASTRVESLTIR